MSKAQDLQFLQSIKDVFDPVFKEYGFDVQGEPVWSGDGEYRVTATHSNIALNFYLAVIPMSPICYCSLSIKLSGALTEKTKSNQRQRFPISSIDVISIAEILDTDFHKPTMEIQTNQELRDILEIEKTCLLKYCHGVLVGDVAVWSKLIELLEKRFPA